MANHPLTGARLGQDTDSPLFGSQLARAVNELSPFTVPRFTTVAARDAAYQQHVANGGKMVTDMLCMVAGRMYRYSGGWAAVPSYRGRGTAFPGDAVDGDTFFHQTLRCYFVSGGGTSWAQDAATRVTSDADRASFISDLTSAGLSMHNGFLVFQTDTDTMWVSRGGTALTPLNGQPLPFVQGAWSEAAGQFGNTRQQLTSVAIPDPGYPYRLGGVVHCELGAVAAGTRWDLWVRVTGGGIAGFDMDCSIELLSEMPNWRRINVQPTDQVMTGACTVIVEARRAYGSGLGQITAYNRRLHISRWAA